MNRWLKLSAVIVVASVVCGERGCRAARRAAGAGAHSRAGQGQRGVGGHARSVSRPEKVRLETFKNRPLASVIQKAFDVNANYLMMAARMMPESAYGFRPTPDLRTFGEQINHATAAQYSFCNQAGMPPGVERRHSAEPCGRSRRRPTSSRRWMTRWRTAIACWPLRQRRGSWRSPRRLGGASSGLIEGIRAHAFMYNNVHDAEDYGTLTVYLRLQGLVPPSSALHPPAPPK